MEIIIQDTYSLYKEIMALPNQSRAVFFEKKLMLPFAPMLEKMNMPITPETLGCFPLIGKDDEAETMLAKLKKVEAWKQAQEALELAIESFNAAKVEIPDKVVLGIFLGNPIMLAQSGGYTGVGSIPGYIQIMIVPNEYNLPKIKAAIVHEFHHNVLFFNAKWNFMDVTLGQYLAVEGLAESFAAYLYGEEAIGPWVTGVQGQDLEASRNIIGDNIDVKGFAEVRKYIFGNHPMVPESKSLGIPYCGGYAVGYHAVQAFLQNTGMSVAEATNLDGNEIMKLSGYFDQ